MPAARVHKSLEGWHHWHGADSLSLSHRLDTGVISPICSPAASSAHTLPTASRLGIHQPDPGKLWPLDLLRWGALHAQVLVAVPKEDRALHLRAASVNALADAQSPSQCPRAPSSAVQGPLARLGAAKQAQEPQVGARVSQHAQRGPCDAPAPGHVQLLQHLAARGSSSGSAPCCTPALLQLSARHLRGESAGSSQLQHARPQLLLSILSSLEGLDQAASKHAGAAGRGWQRACRTPQAP